MKLAVLGAGALASVIGGSLNGALAKLITLTTQAQGERI